MLAIYRGYTIWVFIVGKQDFTWASSWRDSEQELRYRETNGRSEARKRVTKCWPAVLRWQPEEDRSKGSAGEGQT